jgi:hypothetical protein
MDMNKEHWRNDNWYGKHDAIKENPKHEALEARSAFHAKYLSLP